MNFCFKTRVTRACSLTKCSELLRIHDKRQNGENEAKAKWSGWPWQGRGPTVSTETRAGGRKVRRGGDTSAG